jgi:DNA-binding NarL/FixJ family response regulator
MVIWNSIQLPEKEPAFNSPSHISKMSNKIKIGLADDHVLLRDALATLIDGFGNCQVVVQASNGEELIDAIRSGRVPDVLILDLNMPKLSGWEVATWIQENHPEMRVLMLTMYDSELSLIRLLQAGVKGFLKKDIHPDELKQAIHTVMDTGYYYSNYTSSRIAQLFRVNEEGKMVLQKNLLSEQELSFLKLACSELTYKEVALEMGLNPRAVDGLRDQLFVKLDIKSRVGLAIFAIRHGIVNV